MYTNKHSQKYTNLIYHFHLSNVPFFLYSYTSFALLFSSLRFENDNGFKFITLKRVVYFERCCLVSFGSLVEDLYTSRKNEW